MENSYLLFKSIIGSKAYGTALEGSDTDLRGIFIYSPQLWFSIDHLQDTFEHKEGDNVDWELLKFIRLALDGNPNILECLYSPLITYTHDLFQPILEHKQLFLSQRVYKTYKGYAYAQQQKFLHKSETNCKHAGHCIRLLSAGRHVLEHNELLVDIGHNKELYFDIRNGNISKDDFIVLCDRLMIELDKSFEQTTLPKEPNKKLIQELVTNVYLEYAGYRK